MADADVVRWDEADGVATLTLNRPDRMNAWTGSMEERYFDLLQRAADSSTVRAVVVTGAGRGFCPGADMDLLSGGAGEGDLTDVGPGRRPKTFATSIPKIVVAAVNGACAGVGLVQALCCDVRFAAAGARWTTAFSRRGLVAEYGSAWLLPRLVGTSRALDLLASGRVFTSEEALALGLVSRVVPAADVLAEAQGYARDLAASCSPASMAVMKRQVYEAWDSSLAEALVQANELMVHSLRGPDFVEGVQSYLDRSQPAFSPLGEGTTFPQL
ncbi:MAG: Enoyl-CoA hydratase [uncultured Acidimicrobiales bacterium]|uniref:Enoyl-CoA hydratase n=1 Tax=uncultured Acidimicrobiales bacterium TaxID=310071 RepID=A0A6J4HWB3_9ACTN|nr:MAG: Enoyl-CoA hydratase [uncultured Acidimicrobiales bacterium]